MYSSSSSSNSYRCSSSGNSIKGCYCCLGFCIVVVVAVVAVVLCIHSYDVI